jgi:hypothetical protein
MRKANVKSDRPDRTRSFTLSPLVNSLIKAFRPLLPKDATIRSLRKSIAPSRPAAVRFESIEPRILLSGDVAPIQTINGSIDIPGEVDQFGFTLAQETQIVFDSLTNTSGLNWSLAGPQGEEVANRSFTGSDSSGLGNASPQLNLKAGEYTLTVDGATDTTGSYAFRLIDLQKAQTLADGESVTGELALGSETTAYRFSGTAGERYFLDRLSVSGGSVYWRVLDPWGKPLTGSTSMSSDIELTLGYDGTYTLLVEGAVSATGGTSYSFNVQRVVDETSVLTLGDTVSGSIGHAGQRDSYSFSLAEGKQLYFDALSNNSTINWTLTGPRGTVISGRNFSSSDASSYTGNPLLDLAAGDYVLTVDGAGDAVGDYGFRLFDVAQGTALESGVTVAGGLDPANRTDIYRLAGAAGERYYIDYLSRTGGSAYWRLLDPWGNLAAGGATMSSDIGLVTLGLDGTYTLLVEGVASATGITSYSLNVQKVEDDQGVLAVGDTVSGSIGHAGQRDIYNFSLTESRQLYFDSLTSSGLINWTLTGPRGTVVSARNLNASDAGNYAGSPLLDLVAGDYVLIVDGAGDTVGDYSFRLLDLTQGIALQPGTAVNGELAPANGTVAYRLDAQAGDQYNLDYLSRTGGSAYWRLLDPWGNVVFDRTAMSSDIGQITLSYAGAYTLLIEGAPDATGSTTYAFNLDPLGNVPVAAPAGTAIALGSTVAGMLSTTVQQDTYRFTLAADARLYLDSFTANSNIKWSLSGPRGTVVNGRGFYATDSVEITGSPTLDLVAGDYALTVSGTVTGGYSFRVMDTGQAATLTPGTTVSGQLSPANETDLYKVRRQRRRSILLRLQDPLGRQHLLAAARPVGQGRLRQRLYGHRHRPAGAQLYGHLYPAGGRARESDRHVELQLQRAESDGRNQRTGIGRDR